MSELISLTEAEVELVSGGNPHQSNSASVTQVALASGGPALALSGTGTAVAVSGVAFNVSLLRQSNRISFDF